MPQSIRTPLNAGLLLLLATILLGFAVKFGLGAAADANFLKAIALREGGDSPLVIDAARLLTKAGDPEWRWLALIGFGGWLAWRRRIKTALVMIVMPVVAAATCSMLKEAYGRPRPEVAPHLDFVPSFAFPSGHAANMAAILITAALLIPAKARGAWLAAAIGVALAISFSRLLLAVHYPTDILGGMLWGGGFALIALAYARRLEG